MTETNEQRLLRDAEAVLDSGLAIVGQLDAVLRQERAALAERNLTQLTDCIAVKDRLLADLARLDAGTVLQTHDAASPADPLRAKRERFAKELAACRDANRVNARLVERARQAVDTVLATLTGTHRHATYSIDGSGDRPPEPRVIGKA